jgi:hypothetical protein
MKFKVQSAPSQAKLFGGLIIAASLMFSQSVWAIGTASNTTISNLATLNYSVGGTAQAAIGSSAAGNLVGAGTATTFLVDKKVNLTVVETNSAPTIVAPGQLAAVTTFTVTNTGNDPQDFALTGANISTAPNTIFNNTTVLTDTFDATGCSAFAETAGGAGYQAGSDTTTFIDELVANGAGSTATVYVVCNIPAAQANNSVAIVQLTATALVGGAAGQGAALANNTASANTAAVDNVFADAAVAAINADGTIPVQAGNDATGIARDAYKVSAAILTVTKAQSIVCDPVNGTTNQHNIPGAVVRWTITISNAAGAGTANLATVADALDVTNTTIDPNLITGAGALPASCASATGTAENAAGRGFKLDVVGDARGASYPKFLTTTSSVDGADFVTPNVGIDYAVAMPVEAGYTAGELRGGESVVVYYNVTIN